MVNIIRKSEIAKLTTSKFDGVRRCFVVVKTLITIKLPDIDIIPNTKMTIPNIECQSGFNGGN